MQVPGILMWTVRQWALVETDAVSIERLVEYAELPSEEEVIIAPQTWKPEDSAAPPQPAIQPTADKPPPVDSENSNGHGLSDVKRATSDPAIMGHPSELIIEGLRMRYTTSKAPS